MKDFALIQPVGRYLWALIVLAAGGAIIFAAKHPMSPSQGASAITLPIQLHDFGPLIPQSKSEVIFTTRNGLSNVLFIDRIVRSCGCTSAECSPLSIPPGQTFNVKAILTTHADPFAIESHITVYGHTAEQQVIGQYELTGIVKRIIDFPEEGGGALRLGCWRADQPSQELAITVKRGDFPLTFDDIRAECNSEVFTTHVQRQDGDTWQALFRVTATNLIGTFGDPVTFRFFRQGKELPQSVTQQAYVELTGPFVASPPSVLLTASPGDRIQKTVAITVRSLGDTVGAKILGVSSSSRNLAATFTTGTSSGPLTLEYTAPQQTGTEGGEIIVLVSSNGKVYKLRVGFLALIS